MLNRPYDTDLTDTAWKLVNPLLPVARHGGRPRTTDIRAVVNALFYLLRTGCQWRCFPITFHRGVRSTTIFEAGKTLESGYFCIVLSMSRRVWQPAARPARAWSSWTV